MYTQRFLGHMTLVIGLIIGMPRSVSACTNNTYLSAYGFDEAKFKQGLLKQKKLASTIDQAGDYACEIMLPRCSATFDDLDVRIDDSFWTSFFERPFSPYYDFKDFTLVHHLRPRCSFDVLITDPAATPEYRRANEVRHTWHAFRQKLDKKVEKKYTARHGWFAKHPARTFSGGFFVPMSLAALRNKTATVYRSRHNSGSLRLLMGDPANLGRLDIGYLQSRSKNSGATFQVASNFDCLEGVNKADPLDIGLYPTDNTQGPRAAFSAFPGAFVRKYLLKDKVNLLDDALDQVFKNTGLKPSVAYGYLDLSTFTPAQLAQINKNFDQELVKVGVHEKVHVVYGANWTDAPEATNILINQVFTAALDLGTCSGSDNWKVAGNKDVQEIAQKLLNAAYEGTIRAAQIMGSKRLYLTLVGGGVFENKLEHIATALENCSQVIKDSGLQVMLVVFDGSKLDKQLHKRLSKLVKTILQDVVK